jgi:hypothetical protein
MSAGVSNEDELAARWSSREWRDEATAWLDQRLGRLGMERSGEVGQPHLEPWSTVLSADTNRGRVWLKAMVPGTSFEIGLYDVLIQVDPEHVLHPIASDRDRGWLLLPDGGPSLGDRLTGSDLVDAIVVALPQYASLQRSMTGHTRELIDLGLFDLRPDGLPDRQPEYLGAPSTPYLDDLMEVGSDILAWSRRLSGSPVPASIEHNDLHPWNILGLEPPRPGSDTAATAVIYDWGDSVVAHPFGGAQLPISWVRRMVGIDAEHPDCRRMRDAYLEVFDDLASHATLVEQFDAACRLAKVGRAVIWDRSPGAIRSYLDARAMGETGI